MNRFRFHGLLLALTLVSGCSRQREADPAMVSIWMRTLYGAVRAERLSPPVGSRLFAYASTALYSGLTATNKSRPSLAGKLNGLAPLPQPLPDQRYDPTLVAVAAERVLLDSLFREGLPTTRAQLHRLADSLETVQEVAGVNGDIRIESDKLGKMIGLAVVSWSHGDGFDSTRGRKWDIPTGRGLWINDTPVSNYSTQNLSAASQFIAPDNPANLMMKSGSTSDRGLILDRAKGKIVTLPAANMAGVTEPYWGSLRPFALAKWNECDAPYPPEYSDSTGSKLYQEAKFVYDTHTSLTPAQRTTALYWADNAGESGTPAGHWLSIGSQMISEKHLSAPDAAWLMATTSISVADAFISAWGYKFKINLIRPRTYIRIVIDSTWEPTIPTPPFPEYLSGHSTVSAAAAASLTAILGNVAFEDSTSLAIGHDVRHFPSFRAAADEAGMSRIYGGIHFPSGNANGSALGRCISSKVVQRLGIVPK